MLAAWLVRAAPALFYGGQRFTDYGIRLDSRSFAFSSAALLAVALVGALIPLSDAWKRRIQPALQSARTTGTSRWLGALVVAQMALVTGVTCSAGLLWRSLQNVAAIRPAMDPNARVLMAAGFWNDGEPAVRTPDLANRLAGLPGVERVAWARRAMLSGSLGGATTAVEMAGQPKFAFRYNQVSPAYFETTGARVLSGRAFGVADGPAATPVVMVNQAFTRQFQNAEPGQWIKVGGKDRLVVGIVEDGPTINLREPNQPYLYLPFSQRPVGELTFFVSSRKDPALLAESVRTAIRGFDQSFTVLNTVTMKQHLKGARSDEQLAADVTGGLALTGLLLAAAGLFGVTLFAVARRIPEFGVRVAMGATPGALARQVIREAGVRVAIALPLGWATAAAVNPALRAARVDPITALRHQ